MKRRFCEFLVKFRWAFIAVFSALTIAGCVLIFYTDVLYDLSVYLPTDSDANIGMTVLKKEFDDKGSTYVVVKDVSKKDAANLAAELGKIEGVDTVVYVEMQNYVDGNAMYTLSLKDYDSTDGCFATMKRTIKYLDDNGYTAFFTGQSASSYYTKLETEQSILKLALVIVAVIFAMLLFTSKTYFELVPMLITFVVSIALNVGSNFIFNFVGGISYISNLVSMVLQLALSIDYSVILLHRYMEEKALLNDKNEAVIQAMSKGITEIFSSSLTTIAGLSSLIFMALPIGREIGISLAKSIVCSLMSVVFLMPALLVVFAKPLEKTVHKSFVPNVKSLFGKVVGARYAIVPLFIVIIALAGTGQFFNRYAFNMNGGSIIVKNNEAVEECGFGKINTFVVIVPKGNYEKERELAEYVTSFDSVDSNNALSTIKVADGVYLTDEFTKDEFINMLNSAITSAGGGSSFIDVPSLAGECYDKALAATYPDSGKQTLTLLDLMCYIYDDENYSAILSVMGYKDLLGQLVYAKSNLQSDNYSRLTFNLTSGIESDETFAFIKTMKENIGNYYDEFYVTGESVVCYDMAQYFPRDNLIVSLVTIFAVLLILLVTFRNVILPLLLIVAIQGGIWLNFVIPFLAGSSLSFIGYLIINTIQMGATIDYAIVLTNRYNTIKSGYANSVDAMTDAENMVFPTIITSGTILTVTGAALALLSSGVVAKMGSLLAIGTAFSMAIVLFVLPSILLVTEKVYDKCYFKNIFKRKKSSVGETATAIAATTDETQNNDNK